MGFILGKMKRGKVARSAHWAHVIRSSYLLPNDMQRVAAWLIDHCSASFSFNNKVTQATTWMRRKVSHLAHSFRRRYANMGFGKVLKKQRKKVVKRLSNVFKAGEKKALQQATANNNEGTDDTETPQQTTSGQRLSFIDRLNLAANNIQYYATADGSVGGASGGVATDVMEQYDHQVDTSTDPNTGSTTTTVITKDKATGEVISRNVHVQEKDGTIRFTTTGGKVMTSPSPFMVLPPSESGSGSSSSSSNQSPLSILLSAPGDKATIEYTLRNMKNQDSGSGVPATVECKVLDGPKVGTLIVYEVKESPIIQGEQLYEVVKLYEPWKKKARIQAFITSVLLFTTILCTILLLFIFAIPLQQGQNARVLQDWNINIMNSLCMPIMPYSELPPRFNSYVTPARWIKPRGENEMVSTDYYYEAPWWWPIKESKSSAFDLVCGVKTSPALG